MNGRSRAFAIISIPTPSFCLPTVTDPKAPSGMETLMLVNVQPRVSVGSRPL